MKILLIILVIFILIVVSIINSKEDFTSYSIDAIEPDLKNEVEELLNLVIQDINKKYNKKLILGNIDRVEKTNKDNMVNYKINVFVYNKTGFTNINKKITFDIDVDEKNIVVNKIVNGSSLDISNAQRGGISTRGSTLYKPESDVNNLLGIEQTILDSREVDFIETKNKMVDRNKWILPPEVNKKDYTIPTRKILHEWDVYGVERTSDSLKDIPILNHGMSPLTSVPVFSKYNFESKETDSPNFWLFDLAADSASRPIGVGTATGTQ